MVNNGGLGQLSGFPALGAERMLDQIVLPQVFPLSRVIEIGNVSVSNPCIILSVHDLLVLRTVPAIREIRTAGIGTWPFGFIWHVTSCPAVSQEA